MILVVSIKCMAKVDIGFLKKLGRGDQYSLRQRSDIG
jgi:hypothetical protein